MSKKELIQYLQPLRKWWWLIAGAALLAGLSAFLYLRSQPVLYESRTTVMVGSPIQDPNPSNNQFYLTQVLARIYADLARRSAIKEATMNALGLDWLPEYSVAALPDSQVIEISVVDVIPERAQAVANQLVQQLVGLSPAGQEEADRRSFVNQQLATLEKNITDTEDERVRMEEELAKALSAREIRGIQDEIRALDEKLNVLQANYAALLTGTGSGALNAIHVLEPASLPTAPIGTRTLYTIALAMIIGAALAIAGAYALDFMDDAVVSVSPIEKLGVVALSSVPTIVGADDDPGRLVMLNNRYSSAAEAYRVLRTNLQFASVDRPLRLVQITSPSVGEGKSLTAANLALSLAQLGQQVILVDGDLHQPTQHKYFQLVNNVGVTTALLGNLDLVEKMLKPTAVAKLHVLPSGPLPPNPAELLGSKRMQELLAKLRTMADIVVIDSPPVTVISDAVVLATRTDGVLLVARAGKTRLDAIKNSLDALKQVHANILGFVLNGAPEKGSGYYYRYRTDYGVQKQHSTLTGGGDDGGRPQPALPPQPAKQA